MEPKRVLVVDDEPSVRELLINLLEHLGHAAETACDGSEALSKIEGNQFHLVLADFNMPGMKGDELARTIKQRWQGIPVVLITGGPIANISEHFDAVLLKPFSKGQLEQAIDSLA